MSSTILYILLPVYHGIARLPLLSTFHLIVHIPFYLSTLDHSLLFIFHFLISLLLFILFSLLLLLLYYFLLFTFWFLLAGLFLQLQPLSSALFLLLATFFLLILYLHYFPLHQSASPIIYLGYQLIPYYFLAYVLDKSQILIDTEPIMLVFCSTSGCSWNIQGFYDCFRSQICLVYLSVNVSTFLKHLIIANIFLL